MRTLLSIGILASLLNLPAHAAECETHYVNLGAFEINDTSSQSAASAAGGVVGGLVGALIAGKSTKAEANDSEREASLKSYMTTRRDYIIDDELSGLGVDFQSSFDPEKLSCGKVYIVEKNVITYTGVYSLNQQFFKVAIVSGGQIIATETFDKTSNLGIRVFPLAPTRRFQIDKSGKMIEVTKKLEDNSTYHPKVYSAFQESSLKNLKKAMIHMEKVR